MQQAAPVSWLKRAIDAARKIDSRVWFGIFAGFFLLFLWRNSSDVGRAITTIRTANTWWLLTAFAAAALMHVLFALVQSAILRMLGFHIPLPIAVRTYAERQTAATITPLGAASSLLVMTRQFSSYGVTGSAAVTSFAIYSLVGYLTFAITLVPVIIWLLANGAASLAIEIAAIALLTVIVVGLALFARLMRSGSLPGPIQRRLPESALGFLDDMREHHIPARRLINPSVIALIADLMGPVCLYFALRAVGYHPSIGQVAAGYAVGTLFVLVAPVFQGIGIVEVSMTVMLQQLGVPVAEALGATLLYRIGEVWLPVIFGVSLQASHQKRLRGLPALIPTLWTGLTGFLAVLSLIVPLHPHDLGEMRRVQFFKAGSAHVWSFTLAAGILLLYLAYGLMRRQKLAWIATVMLSVVLILTHLRLERDRGIALVAAINLLLLLIYRKRFRVRNDPPSLKLGLITLWVSVVIALTYGVLGFWLATPREFGQEFDFGESAKTTIDQYTPVLGEDVKPRTRRADWFLNSFDVVEIITLSISVIALARPVIWRRKSSSEDFRRAEELIVKYGDSSQDFFKYWPDKSLFFSASGEGVVAYSSSNAVALTLGDPVAVSPDAFRDVLDEFIDFCDRNGWHIAFHQATPLHLDAYRAAGLIAMKIGGEAVVDIDGFSVSGKKMKSLRAVLNRYEREGYRAVVHEPPLSDELIAKLSEVSREWLTLAGRRERGFTLGQYSDDYVRRSTVITVESDEHPDRVEAFINLIPDGVEGEITFDMMRHRVDAPNGAMDFVLLNLIEYGRVHGYHRLSLGMVPFADIGTGPDAPLRERALGLLTARFNHYFSADSLYAYKDKFAPIWEPRYLVYSSDAALPRIGLAIARITEEVPTDERPPA